MNGEPTFDPRRKAAIRELVVTTAADGRYGRARKRTALVVTLVLVALGISGGGVAYALGTGFLTPETTTSPTPLASPTDRATSSPSPTPTPAATPTPTPTPTTSLDAADPSTWTIGFDGVGPVTLGPSLDAQRAALPAFTDETESICVAELAALKSPGGLRFTFVAAADGSGRTAAIQFGNFGNGTDSQSVTPRTAEGIGVSSTLEELLAAYPDITQTGSYSEYTHYYGLTDGHGRWIVFGLYDDVVGQIQLSDAGMLPIGQGRADAIPSERCPA